MKNEETKSAEVRGLENELVSLRTQMRLQQAQAVELAESVVSMIKSTTTIPAAQKAYELAAEILA